VICEQFLQEILRIVSLLAHFDESSIILYEKGSYAHEVPPSLGTETSSSPNLDILTAGRGLGNRQSFIAHSL